MCGIGCRIAGGDVFEYPREEIVAGEHADAVAVIDCRCIHAAARLRVVDDVIVNERRDVDQFHVRGKVEVLERGAAARPAPASSVMRGRKRFPPAASMRLTASVMRELSVENVERKNSSTQRVQIGLVAYGLDHADAFAP